MIHGGGFVEDSWRIFHSISEAGGSGHEKDDEATVWIFIPSFFVDIFHIPPSAPRMLFPLLLSLQLEQPSPLLLPPAPLAALRFLLNPISREETVKGTEAMFCFLDLGMHRKQSSLPLPL